jgi:hypothetical protein
MTVIIFKQHWTMDDRYNSKKKKNIIHDVGKTNSGNESVLEEEIEHQLKQ